jgi:periplasmic protein TonB
MTSTNIQPAIDSNSLGNARFKHLAEPAEANQLPADGGDGRFVPVAFAASLLVHAGVIIAAAAIATASRHVAPPHEDYVYITLTSPEPGISTFNGKGFGGAGLEPHEDLPNRPRQIAHVRHARSRVTKRTREVPGLTSRLAKTSKPAKGAPAPSVIAKRGGSNKAPISLNKEGGPASLGADANGAEGSAGSASGIVVSQPPVAVFTTTPAYPERARMLGIEGEVVLRFIVDQSGSVERDIKIITSIPMLDQAAIKAVRQWRFSPARDGNGNPVRVIVSVPLQFTLQ